MNNSTPLKQRIIGAIVLIALAVIFLPMLLQETKQPKISVTPIPARPAQPDVMVAAPKPVPAVTPTTSAPSGAAWALQLGAFSNQQHADKLVAKLRQAGYPTYTQTQTNATGQKVVRVFVGPEIDQQALQTEAQNLEKKLQIKGHIVAFTAINNPQQGSP